MAIIDEAIRGSTARWWWSLAGLERMQALARGFIPRPPLAKLLGIQPGTWNLPSGRFGPRGG